MIPDLTPFRRPLLEMTLEAGRILMNHYGRLRSIEYKSDINLVTAADREAEDYLRERVGREFPGHFILAEEGNKEDDERSLYGRFGRGPLFEEWTWVIDPLDGTTNFAHSFPLFSVSVALAWRGETLLGAVYNPYYKELFSAEKGRGATLNGAPIRVSNVSDIDKALVVTGFPYDRREKADALLRLVRAFIQTCHGFRRCGSAALDLCSVATGRLDGYWEQGLHPWDAAAGVLIVREAGGRCTDYAGQEHPVPWWQTLASNGKVHDSMLEVIERTLHETP
ncbi:MAG: inositol monophosphatase family protein [Candidatus Sumerlaeia bacterium]